MLMMRHALPALLAATLTLGLGPGAAQAEAAWPERVVTIEDMKLTAPIRIGVPRSRPQGEVKGPTVLRVHVDPQGAVRRVVLLEGSGSPGHDSASIRAMKDVRFQPYLVDGAPADVTLVVPLHLPKAGSARKS